jgi:hypothetical protein
MLDERAAVGASTLPPGVDLWPESVHRLALLVEVAVDGKAFALLPPPHRGDIALQVEGDLLPGVQAAGVSRLRGPFGGTGFVVGHLGPPILPA